MSYTTTPNPVTENINFNLQWIDNGQFNTEYSYKLTILNGSIGDVITTTATNQNEINFNNVMGLPYGGYTVNVTQVYPTDTPTIYNKNGTPLNITCFVEGSEILCIVNNEEKYIKVEDLKEGDFVKTYNDKPKKILYIMKKKFTNHKSHSQICKLSGYPNQTKDLFLTGGHSILVDKLTEEQKNKTLKVWKNLKKIDNKFMLLSFIDEKNTKIEDNKVYNVYHLVLENSDPEGQYGIYANGILTESMSIHWYIKSTRLIISKKKSKIIFKKPKIINKKLFIKF